MRTALLRLPPGVFVDAGELNDGPSLVAGCAANTNLMVTAKRATNRGFKIDAAKLGPGFQQGRGDAAEEGGPANNKRGRWLQAAAEEGGEEETEEVGAECRLHAAGLAAHAHTVMLPVRGGACGATEACGLLLIVVPVL